MRILITGGEGMLGRDLARALGEAGHDALPVGRAKCDVTDAAAVRACVRELKPETVIHAAAWTDVDGCESDPERAMRVNAGGTANIVEAVGGARLVYISTDYVFDGTASRPYTEQDQPRPLSVYGRSKFEGELAAQQHPRCLIVRTSWLYGRSGRHFVGTVLNRARRGETLRIVDDQVGCPTWTKHLARALVALLHTDAAGVLHAAGSGRCSWYEFASAILDEARSREELREAAPVVPITPIRSAELGRPAPRPAFSVLDCTRLQRLSVAPLPDWRSALREYFEVPVAIQGAQAPPIK